MSRTIDERVVSMQFDNKQFESNVQTSLSTLDKLKQSLRLDGAAKGFDNIGAAAKSVNMTPLANAVETVRTKFSALQVMAVTALANITNSAVNAGKQLVKAFTIDPIKSGFQEYETQINAVQTILANTESKGSTLQDVNRALAELNTYADKTIYNFTEMTRNIGTFTAAGVDLKTSVSAIKGIANLAAVSGSTSQQASTAMYQLSQALASGTVKLMDWNSVVNAGMGGQVFQDALKETARVHGIAIDKLIEDEGSFRETLQKGWLTSEILTETLSHFTMAAEEGTEEWETYKKSLMDTGYSEEQAAAILKMANTATDAATKVKTFSQLMDTLKESAQSGWTKSWEIMIGDFEEAKGFLTDISDRLGAIISESADARNKVLSGGLSSGWKQLLDAGIADEEGYKDTFKSVAKEHGVSIDDMIAAEKKLDDSLSDTEAFQKALKTGFKDGSLSADMLSESVHQMADKMSNMSAKELEAAGYTKDHVNEIKNLSAGLKDGSISMDEFVEKINRPSGRENIIQALWNSFDGLMSVIAPIKEAFRDIFPPATGEQLYKLTERIRDFTANLKLSEEQAEKVKSIFKGLFSILDIGFTFIKKVGSGIIQLLGNFTGLRDGILNTAGSFGDWLSNLRDSIKESDVFGKAIDKIVGFIQNGIDKIREFGSAVKEKFAAPGFEGFLGVVIKIWETLKTVGSKIVEIASNIGSAIGNAFRSGDIKSVLDVVNGGIIASILLGIRKYISGITEAFDGSETFIGKIKDLLDTVGDALQAWQQNIKAGTLIKIAAAIGILAASLLVLSLIDSEKLTSSLGAITVLFAELMGSLAIFNKMNLNLTGTAKAVTVMIGMSVAILILASAMKKLAELDWEGIGKGVAAIAALMAVMVGFTKLMGSSQKVFSLSKNGLFSASTQQNLISTGIALIAIAGAMKIFASAIDDLSKISWEGILKGLTGIAGSLLAVALTVKLMPKNMLSTSISLIAIGTAIKVLASAMEDLSYINWEGIGKGVSTITALLGVLALFNKVIGSSGKAFSLSKNGLFSASTQQNLISTGIALIAIAGAMKIFASAIKDLSGLSWEDIDKGLVGIAGALATISLATKFMPTNMISIGASIVVIAVAMKIFASVMDDLSGISWEGIGKGLLSIVGILRAIAGFAALAGKFGTDLIALGGALVIVGIAMKLFASVLEGLSEISWLGINKGILAITVTLALFAGAAVVLEPVIPVMIALGAAILIFGAGCALAGVGITAIATGLTALGATIVITASSIVETINTIVKGLGTIITSFCNSIAESAPAIAEAFVAILEATCYTIKESIPLIAETFFELFVEALTLLKTYIPQLVDLLSDVLVGLMDGLAERMPDLATSVVNLAQKFVASFTEALTSAFGEVDLGGLLEKLETVSKIFLELSIAAKIISTIPITGALTGVVGLAAVVGGIAAILAILGGLSQIPGFNWLLTEGTRALSQIGTAIGAFVGAIVGNFASGVTSGLPKMAENLSSFMDNIQPFVNGAKNIDASVLEGAGILAATILCITASDVISSIASFLTGGSSIKRFGEEIAEFGTYLKAFADNTKGIDAEAVKGAASAAKALAEMASIIPNEGGLAALFAGENSLASFGPQLVDFGSNLKAFSDNVSGINPDNITVAATASKVLAEMASIIPNEGGIAALFAGENSLVNFGPQLADFGSNLKAFSDNVSGINPDNITAATTAAKALAEIANIIPNEGGIAALFAGDNSLASFGPQLRQLGEGLKGFADATSGINAQNATGAVDVAKKIADMTKSIPAGTNFRNFSIQLPKLGEAIRKFADEVGGIKSSNITSGVTAVKRAMQQLNAAAKDGAEGFAKTFERAKPNVNKAVISLIDAVVSAISTKGSSIANEFKSILEGVPDDLRGYHTDFYSAGAYLVDGFAQGITDQTFAAAAAASAMASSALEAARAALGVQSPSKEMAKVGNYSGIGFVNGLIDYTSKAYKAGYGMANKALSGVSNAISRINDVITSDIDTQPTIRPVLDLSDISSGAGAISNMLGLNPSVGMLTNVGAISAMMNRNQNGANDDVISAINNLGRKLSNASGNTYHIDGITYDDGSTVADAVKTLVRAARIERRS